MKTREQKRKEAIERWKKRLKELNTWRSAGNIDDGNMHKKIEWIQEHIAHLETIGVRRGPLQQSVEASELLG